MAEFVNVYQDDRRADAYDTLEFPGTYYLAFRDLPDIIRQHVRGRKALDFGCGTGRSTRFLKSLGFDAIGADIAENMLALARNRDPGGDYRLIDDDGMCGCGPSVFDLILSAFTFDNIPTAETKTALLSALKDQLTPGGRIVNLVSSPDIYVHEWASFSTKDFPENRFAQRGDIVRIVMTDVEDRRPVEDILWPDDAYREIYQQADLSLLETRKPLGRAQEPCAWVNETKIAPWVIYVLGKETPVSGI